MAVPGRSTPFSPQDGHIWNSAQESSNYKLHDYGIDDLYGRVQTLEVADFMRMTETVGVILEDIR